MKQVVVLAATCLVPALVAVACGESAGTSSTTSSSAGTGGAAPSGTPLPAEPQRSGDAQKGYAALVEEGYVSCGVPYSAYSAAFGAAPANLRLPGRTGHNATLPYYQTAFTTKSGVEVVSLNCLVCHSSTIGGQIVMGLGQSFGDYTDDPSTQASLAGLLVSDPKEKVEYQKWLGRVQAIAPYVQPTTVGVNPADNLAAVLFAHRDPATLAWSDTPLLPLPPTYVVPVDVPPWWRMAKKNAMFYVGAGRGDHARIMMTASTLCTDTVAEAQEIDAYFGDVEAYITSLTPPAYPQPIDQALAEKGRPLFESTCSRCHGTYGGSPSYPNLLVALDEVKTDPALAQGSAQFGAQYLDWFSKSFYGQTARLEPQDGYVAPPLDGIWATAPFFHNGSVPTLEAVLDSSKRPTFWTRSFKDDDLDFSAVGWATTVVDHGKDAEPNASTKKKIYDTTQPGYGNGGHTYGDALSDADRAAVIEYLKTL
jgi:mono/diheme cytochrome c family protein